MIYNMSILSTTKRLTNADFSSNSLIVRTVSSRLSETRFSNQAVQFLINEKKIKTRGWLVSYMSNKKLGPAASIFSRLQPRVLPS